MYSKENVELFLLAREDWKSISLETFMAELDAYLTYYDEGRIKRSLGWLSPNEYRRTMGYMV